MNYNSQLQSNNVDLQQVLQTLQHKAAGGNTAYETCTINITFNFQSTYQIPFCYETIENNEIVIKQTKVTASSSTSISCLCNSMIIFDTIGWTYSVNKVDYITNFSTIHICRVSAGANETAELTFSNVNLGQ